MKPQKQKRRVVKVWVDIFDDPKYCNTGHLNGEEGFDECPFLCDNESGCYLFRGDELEYHDEYSYDGVYLKNARCLKVYHMDIKRYTDSV